MTRNKPIKDCVIALRCDHTTKESLEKLAESLDMTVSRLILRLLENGMRLDRERRSKLRQLYRYAEGEGPNEIGGANGPY